MKKVFTMDQTWLQCIRCGYRTDLLDERLFKCPSCGGLYDVCHDYPNFDVEHMKKVFDKRMITKVGASPMFRSGVWRFKELIMPYLPEEYIVTLNEGDVPIIKAGRHIIDWIGGDLDLYIIQEGMTPTGSFKDYGGTSSISVGNASGIEFGACVSTGDTSAMVAAYCAAAPNMSCVVILPEGLVTAVQLAQPLVHNAKIITVPGTFDDCMVIMKELVASYGVYPFNSINPTRIEGHQATVFQLAQFFNWELPDWIAVPVGNGSNSSSIGKGMRLLKDKGFVDSTSRILGCQSHAAAPLYNSWKTSMEGKVFSTSRDWQNAYEPVKVGTTTATAALIGNPASKDKVIREVVGVGYREGAMEMASEEDLNRAVAVCGKDGIFVCPQTGTVFAGLRNAVEKGLISPGERVVAVSTATGLKFAESAAKKLQGNIIQLSDCDVSTIANIMGV